MAIDKLTSDKEKVAGSEPQLSLDMDGNTAIEKQTEPQDLYSDANEANLDQGYAWLILVIMFLLCSTTNGTSRVYGLVYARQIDINYYNHEQASWPIATASTIENLAGIMTPALAQILSWRQIQLLSTSLFILSNAGAYFSDSLLIDILCLGVVQGLALSTSTVLMLAINNDYFDRFRTTAYGFAMSGATCGVLFLCPMVNLILDSDPQIFRPVYLSIAAVLVLNLVLSLFIKPRSETAAYRREETRRKLRSAQMLRISKNINNGHPQAGIERRRSRFESNFERTSSIASVDINCKLRRQSAYSSYSGSLSRSVGQRLSEMMAPENRKCSSLRSRQPTEPKRSVVSQINQNINLEYSLNVDDLVARAARADSSTIEKKTSVVSFKCPNERPDQRQFQTNNGEQQDKPAQAATFLDTFKLLRSPYAHCVWIMLTIYYLVSRIYIIILADFGDDHNLTAAQSYALLNYWSLGELLGRVLLASLIDLRFISVKWCIVLTCTLLSAFILLMVLIENYYVYCVCSTLTAAFVSLEYMLINALMIEYLGKSRAIGCYSIAALISSLLLFGRPTLIGLFRDQLGSYDGLLILLATICLGFGLLFALLEPTLVKRWPKLKD